MHAFKFIQSCFIYLFYIFHIKANNDIFFTTEHYASLHLISPHSACFIKPITSRLDLTFYSAVDKDLQVKTSCIIFLIIAMCVALERFCCSL